MARLNEPSISMDTLESLRRRFLRQNREIARVNSNQSLRIRGLENECARLLSENLDLRGQILRLEKELEDNSARRIADHALEIKAKLEAQLLEWGCVLSSLGQEPPAKRHSPPRERRIARARSSLGGRSPTQRKLRDVAKDQEAAAMQEGRLPPIFENKTYPRATMNSEEILALCTEAASSTDSPDLGPPPVSRFVEDDPIKIDSPTKSTGEESIEDAPPPDNAEQQPAESDSAPPPPPKLDFRKKASSSSSSSQGNETAVAVRRENSDDERPVKVDIRTRNGTAPLAAAAQPVKAGAKRKFGDENENAVILSQNLAKASSTKGSDAQGVGFPSRDPQKQRTIKALSANRREPKEKVVGHLSTRKPLAAKSTNEDLASPKKATAKATPLDDGKSTKMDMDTDMAMETETSKGDALPRERVQGKKPSAPTRIEIPELLPPPPPQSASIIVLPEPESPTTETPSLAAAPDTPDRPMQRAGAPDTPPPADISSNGEISRASRRARAPISYAEPNLRDKMRRPTKELFDAVAGEGKFIHRSAPKSDGTAPGPGSSSSSLSSSSSSRTARSAKASLSSSEESGESLLPPAEAAAAKEAARRESVVSPLAQKEQQTLPLSLPLSGSILPNGAVAVERRQKRVLGAVATAKEPLPIIEAAEAEMGRLGSRVGGGGADRRNAAAAAMNTGNEMEDVYDFATSCSSPAASSLAKEALENESSTAGHVRSAANGIRPSSRSKRRTSATAENSSSSLDTIEVSAAAKSRSSASSRKRSSMALPKRSVLVDPDETEESMMGDTEGSDSAGISARDRISRRRSMML